MECLSTHLTFDGTGIHPALNGYDGVTFNPDSELVFVNSVSAVPVPAAAGLFLSRLGLLGFNRKASRPA